MRGENESGTGTRFRLFPRPPSIHPDRPPEIVCVASPPGSIGPGPSDHRLYLIDPIGKRRPYGINPGPYGTPHLELPPWRGPIRRPVQPDAEGHFDHIPVGTPEFAEAHVFGAVRFTLEVWERYFGRPIEWHFARDFDRLEVTMLPEFDNAHVGYGFMEVGTHHNDDGTLAPFALNFDVIAHELGHLIIYATLGVPTTATEQGEYFGFQESAADMTALVASLHFHSLLDHLLDDTSGNLYTYNELNRFAELSATNQIRLASNSMKLSQFAAGWEDEHALSQPLTGALFDILVDVFQQNLVERGLIGRDVADLTKLIENRPEFATATQPIFDAAYPSQRDQFHTALMEARDYLGFVLAETWRRLSPDFFDYAEVADVLLAVDRVLTGGCYRRAIVESFTWREIGRVTVGPRLSPPDKASHAFSGRTILPEIRYRLPRMPYRERVLLTRGT
jgi:hypothetical protein